MAETAISTFGSIDALVNNAGMFFMKPAASSVGEVCISRERGLTAAGPGAA